MKHDVLSHDEEQLGRAIRVATHLHANQRDKGGKPYVGHPLRVMADVLATTGDMVATTAAVLHDVIKDCHITGADLLTAGFSDEVVDIIELLTRHPAVTYERFIDKIAEAGNARAIAVKLADLRDNMDVSRLPFPIRDVDRQRLEKYRRATARLKVARIA